MVALHQDDTDFYAGFEAWLDVLDGQLAPGHIRQAVFVHLTFGVDGTPEDQWLTVAGHHYGKIIGEYHNWGWPVQFLIAPADVLEWGVDSEDYEAAHGEPDSICLGTVELRNGQAVTGWVYR